MPSQSPVVTGYYRYTDIWFEWMKALPNPEDISPVKAILSSEALVHPDHPLHIEGIQGIQMFIGTFETGEARLLFSSAQIDYIRYWLHAMQLTKTIVPLPYSDCMLTESNLKTVSPVVYADAGSVKTALKAIDKNNKRLKGSNPALTHRRGTFEQVRTLWTTKKGVWCALDIEAWERDHTILTEFGWSLIRWENGGKVQDNGHLIVDEARKYINSQWVPDHRYDYKFEGQSEIVKKSMFGKRVCDFIASLTRYGPVFLVFHDNTQDIKDLKKLGVDFQGLSYILPDDQATSGIYVIDTVELIGALLGEDGGNNRSLDKTCSLLQIPTKHLHNAGNDAFFTLQALESLAGGDPLDMQREKRWPQQTSIGVKVELKPWQEDSDYSDEEGLFPIQPGYKVVPVATDNEALLGA